MSANGFILFINCKKFLLAIKYPSLKPANPKDLEKLFITIKFLFLGTNF